MLMPGSSPPQDTIAAFTSEGVKYVCLRGPARTHWLYTNPLLYQRSQSDAHVNHELWSHLCPQRIAKHSVSHSFVDAHEIRVDRPRPREQRILILLKVGQAFSADTLSDALMELVVERESASASHPQHIAEPHGTQTGHDWANISPG
eukprot:748533-Hanusia_phi.AAC.6